MRDFFGVFIMILLVITGVCVFVFFGNFFGYIGLAIFEIIIVTVIVLLAIRYFRSRRQR